MEKGRQLSLSSFGDYSQINLRRSSIGELGSFIIFKMAMRGVIYIFLCSNVAFKILQRVKWAWRKGRSFAMRSRFWLICLVKFPKLTEYVDKSLKIVPKLLLCIVCWTQDIIWDSLVFPAQMVLLDSGFCPSEKFFITLALPQGLYFCNSSELSKALMVNCAYVWGEASQLAAAK